MISSMTSNVMLDTNMVSSAARGDNPMLEERFSQYGVGDLSLSVVTEGEILFGLAKTPNATRKAFVMRAMMSRFSILPWVSETAAVYGQLRADMRRQGLALSALDMLIAAHALSVGATLITSDRAFRFVPGLQTEDWTLPLA